MLYNSFKINKLNRDRLILLLKRVKKMLKKIRTKKGASTVEYIILIAAVISVLIVFLRPSGAFQRAFNRTFNATSSGMEDMADRLSTSRDGGFGTSSGALSRGGPPLN
jgi:Flp pilus assembly pilin Flp